MPGGESLKRKNDDISAEKRFEMHKDQVEFCDCKWRALDLFLLHPSPTRRSMLRRVALVVSTMDRSNGLLGIPAR
jgi:hypothetical protein